MHTIERVAKATSEPFRLPYIYAILLGGGIFLLWILEYAANMEGNGVINTYLTIISNIFIFVVGVAPLYFAYAGGFGALWSAVNLRDPRAGAAKAVGIYFRLVLWMVFANTLVGLTLSTITFGEAFDGTSQVFPNLLLLVTAAVIFGSLFDFGAGLKKKIITGVLLLIAAILVWNWFGPENRAEVAGEVSSVFSGDGTPDAVSASATSRPLIRLRPRETQAVKWESEGEAMFRIVTPGFDGPISNYVRILGTREMPTLTLRDNVPELEVEVMTSAEAVAIAPNAPLPSNQRIVIDVPN